MLGVFLVGLPINVFDIYALFGQKQKTTLTVLLLVSCISNMVTYAVSLPMVFIGIVHIGLVDDTFCYIQETITNYIIIFRIFCPALVSIDALDKVARNNKRFFNTKRIMFIIISVQAIAVVLTLVPLFGITDGTSGVHQHGCHMWTERVDRAVMFTFLSFGIALFLTIFTTVLCYGIVFYIVKRHTKQVTAHKPAFHTAQPSASLDVPTQSSGASQPPNEKTGTQILPIRIIVSG